MKKKAKYINEMTRQIDRKQRKILLNIIDNKIKKKAKNKAIKNQRWFKLFFLALYLFVLFLEVGFKKEI